MSDTARRIAVLERELASLRQRVPLRPVAPPVEPIRILEIIQGQTLDIGGTSFDGVEFVASVPASVPTAYDPTTPGTAIDGIGWAYLYEDGVAASDTVLVVNLGPDDLIAGDRPPAGALVSIPVDGGGAISAWVCVQ